MYYGEKLNSISHLVGTMFALMGLGALITVGVQSGDLWVLFSFSVFGITLVLAYLMSTLYHSFKTVGVKNIFKVLDHVSIYLLIAGTYTPLSLVTLRDGNGLLILGIVWSLALVGIASEIFLSGRAIKIGQLLIYLGMGWACSFDFASIKAELSEPGLFWLITGGVVYTTGVLFYILDEIKYLNHAHGIWHFFVLVGSICHFIFVIGYVR
jgi:hemolysin III